MTSASAARPRRAGAMRARSMQRDDGGDGGEREHDGERCAVRGGGYRGERHEADAFGRFQRRVAQQQKIEREHAKAGENVGEQNGGQPGQRGEQAERGDDREQQQRPVAEPVRAQSERQHPDGEGGLREQHRPEIGMMAGGEQRP